MLKTVHNSSKIPANSNPHWTRQVDIGINPVLGEDQCLAKAQQCDRRTIMSNNRLNKCYTETYIWC